MKEWTVALADDAGFRLDVFLAKQVARDHEKIPVLASVKERLHHGHVGSPIENPQLEW